MGYHIEHHPSKPNGAKSEMTNPALAEVLASYVPKLIQKRIAADPLPIESPVAEEIQAAVLFADISGFTRLTESLAEAGPAGVEAIANILNEYFGQLIDIVHQYGGDVVKFAGDAVIAVWTIVPSGGEPSPAPAPGASVDKTQGKAGAVSRADQWQWTMRAAECAIESASNSPTTGWRTPVCTSNLPSAPGPSPPRTSVAFSTAGNSC
jgi:class 3 adenylate cyclase